MQKKRWVEKIYKSFIDCCRNATLPVISNDLSEQTLNNFIPGPLAP